MTNMKTAYKCFHSYKLENDLSFLVMMLLGLVGCCIEFWWHVKQILFQIMLGLSCLVIWAENACLFGQVLPHFVFVCSASGKYKEERGE